MLIDKDNPAHIHLANSHGAVLIATIQEPGNANPSYIVCSVGRAQQLKAMTDKELDVFGLRKAKAQIQAAKLI